VDRYTRESGNLLSSYNSCRGYFANSEYTHVFCMVYDDDDDDDDDNDEDGI
jgi:hypothetical protein